jgi:predicted methyltransferase
MGTLMKLMPLLLIYFLSSCTLFKSKHEEFLIPDNLEEAVASNLRDEKNVDRDKYQHPRETLEFFGIKPHMTVVEISPGAGYFTEILAPYLAKNGQFYLAVQRLPRNPPKVMIQNERNLQNILLRYSEVHAKTKLIPFEPLDKKNRIRAQFADLVVTFNSVHNWIARKSTNESFKFFFDVLKPGGILGVVQHRIVDGKRKVPKSGYMTEKEVISLAKQAGFILVGRSEINANIKDTADYPEGVWTLPPTYRLGDKNREKYEDIGESDRMTLKFKKLH